MKYVGDSSCEIFSWALLGGFGENAQKRRSYNSFAPEKILNSFDQFLLDPGRDALADDDYVLEVQLSTTVSASATPSVSSAHSLSEQVLCQSGSSSSLANVVMTEVQILEPDTELAQLALPAKCHIYILDARKF